MGEELKVSGEGGEEEAVDPKQSQNSNQLKKIGFFDLSKWTSLSSDH